jgi:hypothetical protein
MLLIIPKSFLQVNCRAIAMQALRGIGGIAPNHFWPQHYMGWVVSVTPRPCFTPRDRTPTTHCIGRWVGLRAGLDTEAREEILCRGSNLGRPVCSQTLYWLELPQVLLLQLTSLNFTHSSSDHVLEWWREMYTNMGQRASVSPTVVHCRPVNSWIIHIVINFTHIDTLLRNVASHL